MVMPLRTIITLPDPRLRLVGAPVAAVDNSIRALMDDMLETMYAAPGVGLAAIQIAVQKRVIVLDVAKRESETAEPKPLCLANPEILWASDERSTGQEGVCRSRTFSRMSSGRPACAPVTSIAMETRERSRQTAFMATCLQHEIDHLNGVLFIDHISRLKRDRITRKFRKNAKHGAPARKDGAGKERAPASTVA